MCNNPYLFQSKKAKFKQWLKIKLGILKPVKLHNEYSAIFGTIKGRYYSDYIPVPYNWSNKLKLPFKDFFDWDPDIDEDKYHGVLIEILLKIYLAVSSNDLSTKKSDILQFIFNGIWDKERGVIDTLCTVLLNTHVNINGIRMIYY